jgi:ribosomal protein S18 acetylase RimI-like enzyme
MLEISRSTANSLLQELYQSFLNELGLGNTKILSEDTKGEELWIATDEYGEIQGFVSYYVPDNYLHLFYVSVESRHKKIGTQILNYLQRVYGPVMKLKCLVSNRGALAFYRRMGFKACGSGKSGDGEYLLLTIDSPIRG